MSANQGRSRSTLCSSGTKCVRLQRLHLSSICPPMKRAIKLPHAQRKCVCARAFEPSPSQQSSLRGVVSRGSCIDDEDPATNENDFQIQFVDSFLCDSAATPAACGLCGAPNVFCSWWWCDAPRSRAPKRCPWRLKLRLAASELCVGVRRGPPIDRVLFRRRRTSDLPALADGMARSCMRSARALSASTQARGGAPVVDLTQDLKQHASTRSSPRS